MKKTKKITLSIVHAIFLFSSISLYTNSYTITPVVLFNGYPIDGKEWVKKCIEQYPEISWLADAHVRKTEEGHASLQGAYSEQLFGQKYMEFDRTIMTLHCLKLILKGTDQAYEMFTRDQPKESRLTRQSFDALHLQGQKLLKSKWRGLTELQMATAMETALVLGDIGKSEKARELFKPFGITAPDHDDFYGEAIQMMKKHPDLCPSFSRLPESAQQLLLEIANLAHYGHVTHLEGGPAMFHKLKQSQIASSDPTALFFDLFVHTCDTAGALGHINNQSSIAYTELTYRGKQAMGEAVRILANPQKTELDAYNAYLATRAAWLNLNPNDKLDRVLVRMGAMLRLFTPQEGAILKKAVLELDAPTLARITKQLDAEQEDPSIRTPTYIPAVLVNLSSNAQLGASSEEKLSKAVTLGLPFITRVLEKHKQLVSSHQIDPNVPLNFNKIAGLAKTAPDQLKRNFHIDQEGTVSVSLHD